VVEQEMSTKADNDKVQTEQDEPKVGEEQGNKKEGVTEHKRERRPLSFGLFKKRY